MVEENIQKVMTASLESCFKSGLHSTFTINYTTGKRLNLLCLKWFAVVLHLKCLIRQQQQQQELF